MQPLRGIKTMINRHLFITLKVCWSWLLQGLIILMTVTPLPINTIPHSHIGKIVPDVYEIAVQKNVQVFGD